MESGFIPVFQNRWNPSVFHEMRHSRFLQIFLVLPGGPGYLFFAVDHFLFEVLFDARRL